MSKNEESQHMVPESLIGTYKFDPVYKEFTPLRSKSIAFIRLGQKNNTLLFICSKSFHLNIISYTTKIEEKASAIYFTYNECKLALKYQHNSERITTAHCLLTE